MLKLTDAYNRIINAVIKILHISNGNNSIGAKEIWRARKMHLTLRHNVSATKALSILTLHPFQMFLLTPLSVGTQLPLIYHILKFTAKHLFRWLFRKNYPSSRQFINDRSSIFLIYYNYSDYIREFHMRSRQKGHWFHGLNWNGAITYMYYRYNLWKVKQIVNT